MSGIYFKIIQAWVGAWQRDNFRSWTKGIWEFILLLCKIDIREKI